MIRQALKARGVSLTNTGFKKVMAATTSNIRFNRIEFGEMTSPEDALSIAARYARMYLESKVGDEY